MILQNKLTDDDKAYKMLMFRDDSKIVEYIQKLEYNDYELIEVTHAMRLDSLAYKYYNDSSLWWLIAKINNIMSYSFFIGKSNTNIKNILIPLKDINVLVNLFT